MRHKHADIIHAWADGSEIEYKSKVDGKWAHFEPTDQWLEGYEYRIKPTPKQDVVAVGYVYPGSFCLEADYGEKTRPCNLRCTFDGETGKLKSAEVL